jgi:ADP-dependent NAD(P)H-hydrate dehydratase / NAD(P)H-hydrate epimerase
MRIVSVEEMRAIERQADAGGLTYADMMENAGRGVAEQVHAVYGQQMSRVAALVGSGNNGGDALVALAHLATWGWSVCACLIMERSEDDPLVQRVIEAGGEVFGLASESYASLDSALQKVDVVLDGVLGTGIRLPLKQSLAQTLAHIGQVLGRITPRPRIVAVDCPSGVDCDSGEAAPETLSADLTVTMAAVKLGLLRLPAFACLGELRLVEIGPLEGLSAWQSLTRRVVDAGWVGEILPPRPLDSHKGTFGTALIVAGSGNYSGAALLAGKAAYRVGAGLVTMGIPESLHAPLAGHFPEATWLLLPEEMGVIGADAAGLLMRNLARATALLLGPGFGLEKTTHDFLDRLLTQAPAYDRQEMGFLPGQSAAKNDSKGVDASPGLPPLVVDADGLKLLSRLPGWEKRLPSPAVLTPHPGEMAALTGLSTDQIQADRLALAEKYALAWGHVVVLKGALTVVAGPDQRSAVLPVATPALARAGTGDVLAGMIAGLRAQGMPAYEAAVAGAWIHAMAGLTAADQLGTTASVLAGDVLRCIPAVFSGLEGAPGF